MDTKESNNNQFNKLDKEFHELILNQNLNVSSIEELMISNLEDYRILLCNHIEELVANSINEKELITKKNRNGRKKAINYKIKEKEK